jgi:hypothetical protein
MNPLSTDWQSLSALAIVAITVTLFISRTIRNRGKTSCGGGCNCGKPKAR